MKVKACPICGNVVLYHCYHEPMEEVQSVLMDAEQAKNLRLAKRQELLDEIEHLLEPGDVLEKFVITEEIGDGYTFGAEHQHCIEYESAEALICDLEYYLRVKFEQIFETCQLSTMKENQRKEKLFDQMELNPHKFFRRREKFHKDSEWEFCPPDIQTLNKWFDSKKIN